MDIGNTFVELWKSTGVYGFLTLPGSQGWGSLVMIGIGCLLLFLAIKKGFEPLLLIPIGMGCILSNIPFAGIAEHVGIVAAMGPQGQETLLQIKNITGGFIGIFYDLGITSGLFPLLIFMGVGAMTDFGPLLTNPKTFLLGAAASGEANTIAGQSMQDWYLAGFV